MLEEIKRITVDSFGSDCPTNWEEIADWMNEKIEKVFSDVSARWEDVNNVYESVLDAWYRDQNNESLWEQMHDAENALKEIEEEWELFQCSFWEDCWDGKYPDMPTPMDADLMAEMVADYLADHADEYESDPLILDGEPYIDEDGFWAQDAHDSCRTYILFEDSDHDIRAVPFAK